jgi:hypothetical protein
MEAPCDSPWWKYDVHNTVEFSGGGSDENILLADVLSRYLAKAPVSSDSSSSLPAARDATQETVESNGFSLSQTRNRPVVDTARSEIDLGGKTKAERRRAEAAKANPLPLRDIESLTVAMAVEEEEEKVRHRASLASLNQKASVLFEVFAKEVDDLRYCIVQFKFLRHRTWE